MSENQQLSPTPEVTDIEALRVKIEEMERQLTATRVALEETEKRRSGLDRKLAEVQGKAQDGNELKAAIAKALGFSVDEVRQDPVHAVSQRLDELSKALESEKRARERAVGEAREAQLRERKIRLLTAIDSTLASFAPHIETFEEETEQLKAIEGFTELLHRFKAGQSPQAPKPVPASQPSPTPPASAGNAEALYGRWIKAVVEGDPKASQFADEYYASVK